MTSTKAKLAFADDQRVHAVTRARRLAHFGQAVVGFGLREDRQPDAKLFEQQAAVFPIAEVQRDEERAASASSRPCG